MSGGLEGGQEHLAPAPGSSPTLMLTVLCFSSGPGVNAFPCCGKSAVDIVEKT